MEINWKRYKSKPTKATAIQLTKDNWREVIRFVTSNEEESLDYSRYDKPFWEDGKISLSLIGQHGIETLREGEYAVNGKKSDFGIDRSMFIMNEDSFKALFYEEDFHEKEITGGN